MRTHGCLMTVMLLAAFALAGCSQKPPARLDTYLGPQTVAEPNEVSPSLATAAAPLDAALVVVNDVAGTREPRLSQETKTFLTDQVRRRVEASTPIRIVKMLQEPDVEQLQRSSNLSRLAQQHGAPYLLVALFSSAESEVPAYLPLTGDPEQGGQRPRVPGYEAINYALAELALIDSSGQVMARSDGRAWTRLNRLNVPMKSNAYPVIHRSLRVAPIYPPEHEAKDVLRSIAGDEALEQAVYKLEQAWHRS